MNISVAGLWHLGCVIAACCAKVFPVVGYDEDVEVIGELKEGKAPLFEPDLDDLITRGISRNAFTFTSDSLEACQSADLLWIAYDTPVNDDDEADVEFVVGRIKKLAALMRDSSVVLISSQLPVGTCRSLQNEFPNLVFAYSPENLQLGRAIESFEKPARVVIGTADGLPNASLQALFSTFCENLLWMRMESAEMVKHALNSFLALSVSFINEIASVCEATGADSREVTRGLKSDVRIGSRAYLSAGSAFAGGTLARDIVSLSHVADENGVRLEVIPAVKRSNDWHRSWALRRLSEKLGSLQNRRVALMGLAYKPGTNTLRRSAAIELAREAAAAGASVHAFDPAISEIGHDWLKLAPNPLDAARGADALVICTEWPELRRTDWSRTISEMRTPLVLDANRFLEKELANTNAEYLSVGRV